MTINPLDNKLYPPDRNELISSYLLFPWRKCYDSLVSLKNGDLGNSGGSLLKKILNISCFVFACPVTAASALVGLRVRCYSRSYARAQAFSQLQQLKVEERELLQKRALESSNPQLVSMGSDLRKMLTQDLYSFSVAEVEAIRKRTSQYKEFLTDPVYAPLYMLFKQNLGALLNAKLPFRLIEEAKKRYREFDRRPNPENLPAEMYRYRESEKFIKSIEQFASDGDSRLISPLQQVRYQVAKQTFLSRARQRILSQTDPTLESRMRVLEKIRFIHGTNSLILDFLPFTNFRMLPTGKLLDLRIAPMSGELGEPCFEDTLEAGGLDLLGTNNKWISGETIRNFDRSWSYATITKKKLRFFSEDDETLLKRMDHPSWKKVDKWNKLAVLVLSLRQWDESRYQKVASIARKRMDEIELVHMRIISEFNRLIHELETPLPRSSIADNIPYDLKNVPFHNMIDRHLDDSLDPVIDEVAVCKKAAPKFFNEHREQWLLVIIKRKKQIELVHQRVREAIEKGPSFRFTDDKKARIASELAFPILIGSSTCVPRSDPSKLDYTIEELEIGKDADFLFVREQDLGTLQKYFQENHLPKQPQLFSAELFENFPFPLIHESDKSDVSDKYG